MKFHERNLDNYMGGHPQKEKTVAELTDSELDGVILERLAEVGYPSLVSGQFALEQGAAAWHGFLWAPTTTRGMRETIYQVLLAWAA